MTNGTRVRWTSHHGKERTGKFVCDMKAQPGFSMVVGDWDNRPHVMRKSKLFTAKGQHHDRHPLQPIYQPEQVQDQGGTGT
jgi:hypothetical protein